MSIKTGFKTGSTAATAIDIGGGYVSKDYVSQVYPYLASGLISSGLTVVGYNTQGGTSYSTPTQIQSGLWKKAFVVEGQNGGSVSYYGIKKDGTLWSWGSNTYGQLGLGDTVNRTNPTQVGSDTDWVDLGYRAPFEVAFFALKSNGTAYSCGYDPYSGRNIGGAGNTTTLTALTGTWKKFISHNKHNLMYLISNINEPYGIGLEYSLSKFPVPGSGGSFPATTPTRLNDAYANVKLVRSFQSSTSSTTVIKNDGTAWIFYQSTTATQVGSGTNWKDGIWKYLVRDDGTLWCLDLGNLAAAPVQTNITGVRSIFSSETYLYVIKNDGSMWRFNVNPYGTNDVLTTAAITTITLTSQVVSGVTNFTSNSAGLKGLWMDNAGLGAKNIMAVTDRLTDDKKLGFKFGSAAANAIDFGNVFVPRDSIDIKNAMYAAGRGDSAQATGSGALAATPARIGTSSEWSRVAASDMSVGATSSTGMASAIKADGTLWAWGYNSNTYGNLPTGSSSTPTQQGSDSDWINTAVGEFNLFAVKKDGTIYSVGANQSGDLGRGTMTTNGAWGTVNSVTNAVKVWAAPGTFALTTEGEVWAWAQGSNYWYNDVGVAPAKVPLSYKISEIVQVGGTIFIRLVDDGKWYVFGYNGSFVGNIGGMVINGFATPQNKKLLPDSYQYRKIFSGGNGLWATGIDNQGRLWGWGTNQYNSLCQGAAQSYQATPVLISGLTHWKAVYSAGYSMIGLTTSGDLYWWGVPYYMDDGAGYGQTSATPNIISSGGNKFRTVAAASRYFIGLTY